MRLISVIGDPETATGKLLFRPEHSGRNADFPPKLTCFWKLSFFHLGDRSDPLNCTRFRELRTIEHSRLAPPEACRYGKWRARTVTKPLRPRLQAGHYESGRDSNSRSSACWPDLGRERDPPEAIVDALNLRGGKQVKSRPHLRSFVIPAASKHEDDAHQYDPEGGQSDDEHFVAHAALQSTKAATACPMRWVSP